MTEINIVELIESDYQVISGLAQSAYEMTTGVTVGHILDHMEQKWFYQENEKFATAKRLREKPYVKVTFPRDDVKKELIKRWSWLDMNSPDSPSRRFAKINMDNMMRAYQTGDPMIYKMSGGR